jgi:hypothetical protein
MVRNNNAGLTTFKQVLSAKIGSLDAKEHEFDIIPIIFSNKTGK